MDTQKDYVRALFLGLDESDRLAWLRDNVYHDEKNNEPKIITDFQHSEELTETRKAELSQQEQQAYLAAMRLKDEVAELNTVKKEQEKIHAICHATLAAGHETVTEDVYGILNETNGWLQYYNIEGEIIHQVKVKTPQLQMKFEKTGTND